MDMLKENRVIIFINRPLKEIIKDIDITRPIFNDKEEVLFQLFKERYNLYKKYSQIEIINSGTLASVVDELIYKLKI